MHELPTTSHCIDISHARSSWNTGLFMWRAFLFGWKCTRCAECRDEGTKMTTIDTISASAKALNVCLLFHQSESMTCYSMSWLGHRSWTSGVLEVKHSLTRSLPPSIKLDPVKGVVEPAQKALCEVISKWRTVLFPKRLFSSNESHFYFSWYLRSCDWWDLLFRSLPKWRYPLNFSGSTIEWTCPKWNVEVVSYQASWLRDLIRGILSLEFYWGDCCRSCCLHGMAQLVIVNRR